MKQAFIECLLLPKGMPIDQYENLAEITKDAGSEQVIVDIVNKYCRQKDGLVDGRDQLSTFINDQVGFKVLTKAVKKKDDEGKETTVQVPDETEVEHLKRFATAVAKGEATVKAVEVKDEAGKVLSKFPAFTPTGNDIELKVSSVWGYLQTIADTFKLRNNAAVAVRESKPKEPAKTWKDAAEQIFSDAGTDGKKKDLPLKARLAKWVDVFTKEGVPFEDFTGTDQAVAKRNLAFAIAERERRASEAKKKQYA